MTQGECMRKARKRAKLSLVQLSEISGVPNATIGALERDVNRSGTIATIELLADALGLSIDEYVGHEVKRKRGCDMTGHYWSKIADNGNGYEAKSNDDGSYTVVIDGKEYKCKDTDAFLHFLEGIGRR